MTFTIPMPVLITMSLTLVCLLAAAVSALRWWQLDRAGALAGATTGDPTARERFREAQTHARDAVASLGLAAAPLITMATIAAI